MTKPSVEEGRVVVSMAGHDKGRAFVVIGWADEIHALIADGETRRVEAPKKKKIKHLRAKPESFPNILEKMNGEKRALDSEIRKRLSALPYGKQANASGECNEEA